MYSILTTFSYCQIIALYSSGVKLYVRLHTTGESIPACLRDVLCRSWRRFERRTLSSVSWFPWRTPPLWRAEPAEAGRTSGRVPPPSHSGGLCSSPASQWCCSPPVRGTSSLTAPMYTPYFTFRDRNYFVGRGKEEFKHNCRWFEEKNIQFFSAKTQTRSCN